MRCDMLIVGGGVAGLTAAIRLMQLAANAQRELNVIVLEKGAEVGAHILSGAVLELRALKELFPQWDAMNLPLHTPVTRDRFALLTPKKVIPLPTPPQMHNQGNVIISLGELCRALSVHAESLGVQIFAGFPAQQLIIENEAVCGVRIGAFGLDAQGVPLPTYQPSMDIRATHTLLAEGARGSLTKELIAHYDLRSNRCPQTYALGLKEVWEIDPAQHRRGEVFHSVGWPLDTRTYGGSFIYHHGENQLSLGFVVGLDYENPYLDPYETLQTFKTHPAIAPLLRGGKRIAYGARALNEGGWQSIPRLSVAGASLIGCAAGFVNVPKIKGIHTSMKSAMLAAESAFEVVMQGDAPQPLMHYEARLKDSWVGKELYAVRNIRPAFRYGLWAGLAYSALDTYVLRGKAPWTFKHRHDHASLKKASACKPYHYASHDGVLTFDKLDSVYVSNTNHRENQPVHLQLKDTSLPLSYNLPHYANPETRYCPAGVYEVVKDAEGNAQFNINAQNCIHCKTCDIKDPLQNIHWIPPEGGGGCNYVNM